jgi:predicted outer membrane repeat protein
MKTLLMLASFSYCLALRAHCQSGGTFFLESSTLDSGGGISTGGSFSLSGTIGQPDAGLLSGGTFTLSGGFWEASVIQTPGAPRLRLQLTPGPRAVLSWPDDDIVWQLETSTDLLSWAPTTAQPTLSGGLWFVTTGAFANRQFFRLTPAVTP